MDSQSRDRPLGAAGRLALAGTALAVVLAGCVSIPTESAVERGRDAGARDEPQLNSNLPPGPQPGAMPEAVVAGFFDAMLAYPRSDSLAREFLSPGAAADWDPDFSLVVYDDQDVSGDAAEVRVRARRLGVLDGRGTWSSASAPTSLVDLTLQTERVGNQWRISNPPVGTYIDTDYFDRYYEGFSLYYFDPTASILSPDPVYYLQGDSTATELVENLLVGPSPGLGGVVSTAVPDGLGLTGAVSVSASGRAEIPLTNQARAMEADDLRLLAAQLTWTLRPVVEIDTMALLVDGVALDISGSGRSFGIDDFSGYDPAGFGAGSRQLFGLTRRGLVTVSVDGVTPVTGSIGRGGDNARSAAVDPSAAQAALVDATGRQVLVGAISDPSEGVAVWYEGGTDVLRPSWDIHGLLWVVDNTPDGARLTTIQDGQPREVDAPGITGREVLGFSVSRDGTRLAVIVRGGGDTQLVVSMIDRDADQPSLVTLAAADDVVTPGLSFSRRDNVSWLTPTSLAVLANDNGGDLQPLEVRVDGSSLSTFDGFLPVRPVTLAAAPNPDVPLVVGGSKRTLYLRAPESGWTVYGPPGRVRQPVYPG